MAFNFLGTFSKRDLETLTTYLQSEMLNVDATINHLLLESNKLQKTLQSLIDYAKSKNIIFKTFDKTFYIRVQSQVDDSDSARLVQLLKSPFYQNIRAQEQTEYKIKKIFDKIEQLQERVHYLRIMKSEFNTDIEKVNSLFDTNHRHLTVEKEVV
ncbi:MAG: hypothetical protein Q7R33_01920 [Nitrosarchaeum sp.]|nr:hypothetical protein [Nitrosarchaeum sp.]